MSEPMSLHEAVDDLCRALHDHATACESGDPPPVVISKGERVHEAVLQHERLLMERARWSSPLRHLSPPSGGYDSSNEAKSTDGVRILVKAVYHLLVDDTGALVHAIQTRFGDGEITDLADAIQVLVRSDGWDPNVVSNGGLITVRQADISVDLE